MELITPGLGLVFWMTISFGVVLIILRKYAWRPILNVIREREHTIAEGLRKARQIENEVKKLDELREQKLHEANEEATHIVNNANIEAQRIINKSREQAKEDAEWLFENTKKQINAEYKAAEQKMKQQIIAVSLDMAQTVLQDEFEDIEKKNKYVVKLLDNIQLS